MGNLMAGLGLAILAFILFLLSGMFSRYPARNDNKTPKAFFWMRTVSYILFVVSFVVVVTGFM